VPELSVTRLRQVVSRAQRTGRKRGRTDAPAPRPAGEVADEFTAIARSIRFGLRQRAWSVLFDVRDRRWLHAALGVVVARLLAGPLLSTISPFFDPLVLRP
jgi:hypothetical protein